MQNVVLFFQSTVNKSWRDKLSGVYRYAKEADWQIQVLPVSMSTAQLRQQFTLWNPLGCLVDRGMSFARCPTAFFGKTPVVFLDQNPKSAPKGILNVIHDSAACSRLACTELRRCDCASYLYYSGEVPAFWLTAREQAFRSELAKVRRPIFILHQRGDLSQALKDAPKPCGVFAAHDLAAQQVISEANRLGIGIPGQLYVVGIDNDELICENTRPALTSVLPDFERAGYELAKLLDAKLHSPQLRGVTIKYGPVNICRRETTRKLVKSDIRVNAALDFIRQNAVNPDLRVDDIVQKMKCSRRFADLRFREIAGHSILEEIQSVRFDKVLSLLRKPTLNSIGSIAGLCGYNSDSFLKRLFKRKTGMTMRDWRKKNVSF